MSFHLAWLLSAAAVLGLYAWLGHLTRTSVAGLLVDNRERYSLNHFQLSFWTVLVLSTLLAVFIASGFDAATLGIPQALLILMGISVGTAAGSGVVKSKKDATPTVDVARAEKRLTRLDGSTYVVRRKAAQLFLEEDGKQADQVVSITKFQNFVLTLIAGRTPSHGATLWRARR